MIGELKPYPAMKDSGVEWLGEVPEHWALRRTKTLLKQRVEKGFPDEPLLAATQAKGVVLKEQYEHRTVLALKDLHLLKLVRKGDFVISLRSFQGGIEHAREQGIISPAYTVLYPVETQWHGFLAWLFKSKPYIENLALYVTGIRQGQNIDYEKLSRSRIPLPPRPEHAAIVRFLDHAERRIRRYIRAKQKLIKLLEEQKQAVIHGAVTRGLDQDVPLKDSGVEWLGEVPKHWDVRRFKSLVSDSVAGPYGSSLTKAMYTSEGYRVYGQQQVIHGDFSVGDYYISESKFSEMSRYRVFPGDLLVSVMGTIGRTAVVPDDIEPGIINPRLVRYRPRSEKVREHYLHLAMQASPSQDQLTMVAKGTTMEGLNMGTIANVLLAIPPLSEQDRILMAVEAQNESNRRADSALRRETSLLRELRTRLIADVVTGKLDVREVAARLPENEDVVDEPDDLDEDEPALEDSELDAELEEIEA